MYLSFYRLQSKPFQNSTHPGFFWLGEMHKEALTIFKYGILKMPGILVLTGDVGTGKTTLINVLINNLGDKFIVVKIPDPDLEAIDFVNSLSDKLDFGEKFASKGDFYKKFIRFLGQSSLEGRKVLLVVDECQRLASPLLEEISTLATLEKGKKKSLTVLLIGQDTFNDVLLSDTDCALNKLVSINYSITPLNLADTGQLIKHRLKIAGAKKDIFTPDAITKIYQFSAGIPRRINIICDHVLLIGFAKGAETVNAELVTACVEELSPQGDAKELKNPSMTSLANEDFRYLRMIPPKSREKITLNRAGKIFGMISLCTIPLFLIIIFVYQMPPQDGGNPGRENSFPASVRDQTATRQEERTENGLQPEKVMVQKDPASSSVAEGPADDSGSVANEGMQEEQVESKEQAVTTSSWKDGFPETLSQDRDTDDKQQTNMGTVLSLSPDEHQAAKTTGEPTEQMSSDTAVVLPSTTRAPSVDESEDKTGPTPQDGDSPAALASAGVEQSSIDDLPEVRVSEQTNQEAFLKENVSMTNAEIVEDAEQQGRNEPLERQPQPDRAEETQEGIEKSQENFDPGAIIDWVIKTRSK